MSGRVAFTGKSGKTYHFQRFRKPHKKIFSVEPTYGDQALSDIRPLRARPARKYAKRKRCEILGKVPTQIKGYSYKHKKTGKTVHVRPHTRKVLKCLD